MTLPTLNHPKRHWPDYFILIILLASGIVGFVTSQHQPTQQLLIICLTAGGYVAWGIWHHLRRGGLYWPVVLEYLLLAGLVLALIYSLML